jgi:hypothetical protein
VSAVVRRPCGDNAPDQFPERRPQRDTNGEAGWGMLRATALSSLVLWFLTTLVGAALPNIG